MKHLIPLVALGLVGCGTDPVVSVRPSPVPAQLTLTALRDGTIVRVNAQVRSASGENIAGTIVTFLSSSGTPSPGTAMTDAAGMVASVIATTAAVTVTATNGGMVQTATAPAFTPPPGPIIPPLPPPTLPPSVADIPIYITSTKHEGDHETWNFRAAGDVIPNVEFYRWDFGDGETAADESTEVRHIYTKEGTHVVTVEAVQRGDRRVIARGRLEVTIRLSSPRT